MAGGAGETWVAMVELAGRVLPEPRQEQQLCCSFLSHVVPRTHFPSFLLLIICGSDFCLRFIILTGWTTSHLQITLICRGMHINQLVKNKVGLFIEFEKPGSSLWESASIYTPLRLFFHLFQTKYLLTVFLIKGSVSFPG